jgi:NADH-quinone oxidoreductase subunit L
VWLPDAMAGPTPVSALIHAATMVTAGIYMMIRSNVLYELAPTTQSIVAIVGALTAFVAGTSALRQLDIKKVLAYSTVSQLGYMVAACGLGAFVAGDFHLLTHAFFKAVLFLAAGSVIHGLEHGMHASHEQHVDPQDMRNMGGLARKMPITFVAFLLGGLALAGVPPLSGFFSKDEILVDALNHNLVVFALLAVTAVITAFYIGRQLVLVFSGKPRTEAAEHAHESNWLMTVPLIILTIGTVFGGVLNLPALHSLTDWLKPITVEDEVPVFNVGIAALFSILAIVALAGAWFLYRRPARANSEAEAGLGRFLYKAWHIDDIYQAVIVKPFYAISTVCAQVLDVGVIDGIVNGIGRLARSTAGSLRKLETGFVRTYGLIMLLGVVAVVAYFVLSAR